MLNRNHAIQLIGAITGALFFSVIANRYKAKSNTQLYTAFAGGAIGSLLANPAPPNPGLRKWYHGHLFTDHTVTTAVLRALNGELLVEKLNLSLRMEELAALASNQLPSRTYKNPHFWWKDQQLDEKAKSLAKYGVKPGDDIHVVEAPNETDVQKALDKAEGGFKIFTKTLKGDEYSIMVKASLTTKELKLIVYNETGVEPERQRLIYAGKQLEDGKSLQNYNIKKEAKIHIVQKMFKKKR